MDGKTKIFIEDTIITVVLIIIIAGLYYGISNFILDDKKIEKNTSITNVTQKEMSKPKNTLKAEDSNTTQNEDSNSTNMK